MEYFILMLFILPSIAYGYESNGTNITLPVNSSDAKKDMYVVHAMVYQVGIITNKTNNESDANLGKQEAITFFNSNGSKIDFSKIPQPILTNITAQSVVGVLPSPSAELSKSSYHHGTSEKQVEDANNKVYKRSVATSENDTVKIVKGSMVIPKEAGVHSLAIPPLLALNTNLTNVPVPIPNTSVVHYDEINTLIHIPGI